MARANGSPGSGTQVHRSLGGNNGRAGGFTGGVRETAGRAVRDSKDPDGGALVFGTGEWMAFIERLKGF